MTANLTPEHVSEVAEEIALTLPPDPHPRDHNRGMPTIVEVRLVDQYGVVVASAPISCPIMANGGEIEIQVPPIVLTAS